MIKIHLENVASCHGSPVVLETDKKVNLVYGLNGTGKTTLSDFLYFKDKPQKFRDCRLEGAYGKKVLVYNESFIRDNFYDTDDLKGIFTLSKANKDAGEIIENVKEKMKNLEENRADMEQRKSRLEAERHRKNEDVRNAVWRIKTEYTRDDRALAFCLERLQRKELLFEHISAIRNPAKKPDATMEGLRTEAKFVVGTSAQKCEYLGRIETGAESIEEDAIFSEVIVGNEYSAIAELIQKLDNSDWVRRGLDYLPDWVGETEQCPFCQQETVTPQIAQEIEAYFDETYERKISRIKQLGEEYEEVSLPNIGNYTNHPLMGEHGKQFERLYMQLQSLLDKNCSQIAAKLTEPSQRVEIYATKNKLKELNELVSAVNQKVSSHNDRLDDQRKAKEEIKNTFWRILRWKYNDILGTYYSENRRLEGQIAKLANEIGHTRNEIQHQESEMVEQQKGMINIEDAVRNINGGLRELGIEGFSIVKYEEDSYRIAREGQSEKQFSTLSEGEKTIISFLYFMELCKGKENEEEIEKEKIVVIDDPVSSLSHIYIFNLSQWIKSHFFSESYKNIFVLTHSLYFFHELVRNSKHKALFRITKSSELGTQIQTMSQDDISNEYESYWQVIRDHGEGKASHYLLANSMRNILEHFFGFIDKASLREIFEELGRTGEFNPFYRFMMRESHSDATNITDNKEIDPELFKEYFRKAFSESGYGKHYTKMMNG